MLKTQVALAALTRPGGLARLAALFQAKLPSLRAKLFFSCRAWLLSFRAGLLLTGACV